MIEHPVELRQLLDFEDVKEILGRICIHCGEIADILRHAGQIIPRRAEDEQAAVIYYLLGQYVKHGKDWKPKAEEDLKQMITTAVAEGRFK